MMTSNVVATEKKLKWKYWKRQRQRVEYGEGGEKQTAKKKTNWKFCKWIKQYILFCQNKAACKRVYIFNSLSLFERPRALHYSHFVSVRESVWMYIWVNVSFFIRFQIPIPACQHTLISTNLLFQFYFHFYHSWHFRRSPVCRSKHVKTFLSFFFFIC